MFDLAHLIADGVVSLDELDGFSEELQNMVRVLCERIELEEQQEQLTSAFRIGEFDGSRCVRCR